MSRALPIIIGTAGHVDHGKTSLVKALTGFETDRHPEEKLRGVSIDFAVAPFVLSNGDVIGLVDVPGHQDFIKNMTAGASSIEIALLIVAADDGVMPQTREHLQILSHLGAKKILPVITKKDLVSEFRIKEVEQEIEELLVEFLISDDSRISIVSSITNYGISELRLLIEEAVLTSIKIEKTTNNIPFRMYVRSAFIMKGAGVVVTGIPCQGMVLKDQELELITSHTRNKLDIRSIQNYRTEVLATSQGISSAINLRSAEVEDFERGVCLATPNVFNQTKSINVWLKNSSENEHIVRGRQFTFCLGTLSAACRVYPVGGNTIEPGMEAAGRILFSKEVVVSAGDKFILRDSYTVAGGSVLSISSRPIRKRYSEKRIEDFNTSSSFNLSGNFTSSELLAGERIFIYKKDLVALLGLNEGYYEEKLAQFEAQSLLIRIGKTSWINAYKEEALKNKIFSIISKYHLKNPLKLGLSLYEICKYFSAESFNVESLDEEKFRSFILKDERLTYNKTYFSLKTFKPEISKKDLEAYEKVLRILEVVSGISKVNLLEEIKFTEQEFKPIQKLLESEGLITNIQTYVFSTTKLNFYKSVLLELKQSHPEGFSLIDFRGKTALSRNLAVPVLENFDSNKLTIRVGDLRKVL